MVTPPLSDELERTLDRQSFDEEDDERLANRDRQLAEEFPEPTKVDIDALKIQLDREWRIFRKGEPSPEHGGDQQHSGAPGVEGIRNMRFGRDVLPPKWRAKLNTNYRFRANLTHSEILRVVAMATRNVPRVDIASDQIGPRSSDRAEKQTRWGNALIAALERQANEPLYRRFADAEVEAGMGAWEVFETGAFDDVDTSQELDESDASFNKRIDETLRTRGLPIGIRTLDPLTLGYEADDLGIRYALITERKRYRTVFAQLQRDLSPAEWGALHLPQPGTRGGPEGARTDVVGEVQTFRYYDRRWFQFWVGSELVISVEHGLPGVPIILAWGMTTSSSARSEQMQGIVWGMVQMEQALNDAMTLGLDIGVTFARPKPVVETPIEGSLRSPDGRPSTLDFSGDGIPEMMPGQKLTDAFKDFDSKLDPTIVPTILGLWQRAGLNPIASGESPGADPSGFAINSLMASSQVMYEVLLDNLARAVGELIDFVRLMIRDTIREPVSLAVPAGDRAGVEWLALGPEDITDVPAIVSIDPLNDVNRLAIRQSLMDAMERKLVPRRIVQTQGFGAADADEWDDEIAEDIALVDLLQMAVELAIQKVMGGDQGPEQPQLFDTRGNVLPLQPGDVAAEPARLNPASVGEAGEASRNGGAPTNPRARTLNPSTASAGQQPSNQPVPPARGR